jgi:hypothetical protein
MRFPVRFILFHVGVACLLSWSAGCGGASGAANREKTIPVTGKVTYNGEPVADATVTLVPDAPPPDAIGKRAAFGRTDSSGRFSLRTFEPDDGAVPGKYKVTVTKYEVSSSGAVATSEEDYVPPEEMEEDSAPPKSLLPEVYSKANSTTLTADVADGAAITLDLELKD